MVLSDLFLSRSRTQLYGYNKVRMPFHVIRMAQWICCIIVSCIMSFFMYHLHLGNYPIPGTFKVLMTVSWLTMGCLAATMFLHLTCGLNPRLNFLLNTTNFCIWNIGYGMLTWYMWGTLTHHCDPGHWNDGNGIMVCQIYKALFTFSLLGDCSTLLAMILDFHIIRMNRMRGQHFQLSTLFPDRKSKREDKPSRNGPYVDIDNQPDSSEFLAQHQRSRQPSRQGSRDNIDFTRPGHSRRVSSVSSSDGLTTTTTQNDGVENGISFLPPMRRQSGISLLPPMKRQSQFDCDTGYHPASSMTGAVSQGSGRRQSQFDYDTGYPASRTETVFGAAY